MIFPAIRRRNWSNAFRVSALLTEEVEPDLLRQAVEDVLPRFPSIAVRLRRGLFWYYLEQAPAPEPRQDGAYPLIFMSRREIRACAFRVLYYRNRVAVEFFHALTDGSGGMIFLKTLLARYLALRHGVDIPAEEGVLDWKQAPQAGELEDSFHRYAGPYSMARREANAYRLRDVREPDGRLHLTCGVLDTEALRQKAKEYGVTVTAFLAAVMTDAITELQLSRCPGRRQKPVKISVPVNLRRLFPSQTLRNFALFVNTEADPSLGRQTLPELCRTISAQLSAEVTPQRMASRIAANVAPARSVLLRLMPLPVKNLAMRAVYSAVGENKCCLNVSNLGLTRLPPAMEPYVERLDFIIGVQATYYNNCSVVSYQGRTMVNMIRSVRQPELERLFFTRLVELGLEVTVESNGR